MNIFRTYKGGRGWGAIPPEAESILKKIKHFLRVSAY